MSSERQVSRRTILRGFGTAMAVPFLEALSPAAGLAAELGAARAKAKAPIRMAFLFAPNGVHVPDWKPLVQGRNYALPWILEPLAKVKDQLLVISGLAHDKGRANGDGPGDHARSASVFLTGAQPWKTDGAKIRSGISVDQQAAQQAGHLTRFPSLELACDDGRNSGNCDSGYSCAYSNNISWASPTTPTAKEIDPRRVFDRLFAGARLDEVAEGRARRERQRKSILDFVLEDSRQLERRLGGSDRRKLGEYFASVREIEKRLELVQRPAAAAFPEPENLPSEAGVGLPFEEHLRLLCDMIVLAFQGDVTRIASFMFARDGSNRSYRMIEVPDGHHDLSHHQGRREKHEKIRKIDRFHVTQVAYFLERLQAVREEDGSTLLDNCMVLYGSGIGDGNAHNHDNLPMLLAGRGGGSLDSARHIEVPQETPVCNLFVSMLERFGTPVEAFGDSTGPLLEL